MLNSDSRIYSPLSQVMTDTMTDSDSEEEIHNSARKHQRRQHQYHQQQHYQIASSNNRSSFSRQPQNYSNHNGDSISVQNSFRNIMTAGSRGDDPHFSSFNSDCDERHQTDADNVAILGTDDKSEPMSPARRFCFILSILVCVVTVVLFLWVVPCGDGKTCPAPVDRVKTHNWLNNYTKIELKGIVNVVIGGKSWERNLIFLYKGDVFFPEFEPNNRKKNGVICLAGRSGAVEWFDETINEPVTIDCTLLDVDKNGRPDCLVFDEYGEIGVIDPVSGVFHWKFIEKSPQKVDVLDFPVVLPDMDGDGVLEILMATSKAESKSRNFLQIISGRTGQPLGHGYRIPECAIVRKFQLEKDQIVSFTCVKNGTESQRSKDLSELFSLITNKSVGQKLMPAAKISQHRHYGQRKETEAQRNIYALNGKELVVENRGKCPYNCNMTFILSETLKNGTVNMIRNFTMSGMYGMVPAQWHFKNGKSKLSGFVMKFWEWANATRDAHPSEEKRQKRESNFNFPASEFNVFEHVIQKRETYTIPSEAARVERSIANITKHKSGSNILLDNYKMQIIKETVVLIIFNGAFTNIENTSQSQIVQFCRNDKNDEICQPDLNNQENSLMIADLDQDGSQELVSYYTTFANRDDDRKDWKLVTFVQLLRLESELPSLYEGPKRN